ncbi:MAG: D-alanine--D-alanine ligase [Prevotellaceae bacterium]|jgi:D-alanine-D-alanine ligase|nr:D-alanine--D-alanine ligase [Prevotellaceae bacterium]
MNLLHIINKNMKNIAIVAGGNSSEYEISLKSASQIMSAVDRQKFNPFLVIIKGSKWIVKQEHKHEIDIDKNDFSFTENGSKTNFDCAYVTIHGTPGEDGKLQGYFEMIRLPYSTCDVLTSALSFNKFACKSYLATAGICMPKGIQILKGEKIDADDVIKNLGLPVFVKPNEGGSSFGISKVKSANDLQTAVDEAFEEDKSVIVEEFIEGRELTCGMIKIGETTMLFPVTEIITQNDFFDYDAKYNGQSQEITPAKISEEATHLVHDISSLIYNKMRCKGLVRIDYIYSRGKLYFLEINIAPGMTAQSLVPQQIQAAGETLTNVITMQIEDLLGNNSAKIY